MLRLQRRDGVSIHTEGDAGSTAKPSYGCIVTLTFYSSRRTILEPALQGMGAPRR